MPTLKDGSKPQIFLLDDPAREKSHAANYTTSVDALRGYSILIDAIYPAVRDRDLSPEALAVIARLIDHSAKIVWETAGKYLMTLAHYFPAALDLALSLGRSQSSGTRLRVLQSQSRVTLPEPHLAQLLLSGLADPSIRVRQFAAIRCGDLHRLDLLPHLHEQLSTEPSSKVRESIQYAMDELNKPAANGG